ncbi:hypothetical protein ABH935_009275 [Catenulispora sp. GAS73]|uniref:hypothetical protein n=1 Tax=Catenulispora sp. GAS73 TaxID=3156269 RepID=UPI003517F180
MTARARLRTAALLTGLALIATLGIPAANADTGSDGFPILYASVGQEAHKCEVIGSDQYGNQAVICADLMTIPTFDLSSNNVYYPYYVWAEAEALCQTSAGVVEQCANILVNAEVADGAVGAAGSSSSVCGHAAGACPVGRLTADTNFLSYNSSVGCSSDPHYDVWGIVLGGGATVIELPKSGKNITLGSNFSTGHNWICM